MDKTLNNFLEIKGSKSITKEQAVAFGVTDFKKGWVKRFGNNVVDIDTWKEMISGISHYNRKVVKKSQRVSPSLDQYLYLFKSEDERYKVGVTNDLQKRRSSVRSSSGLNISIEGAWSPGSFKAVYLESLLLDKYKKFKTIGEWLKFPEGYPVRKEIIDFLEMYSDEGVYQVK